MEITSLKKYKGSTYEAELDGERKIYLHIDIISDFGLRSGMEIDRQRLREVIYASNFRRAYQRALFLLDHIDHSRKELFGKLIETYKNSGLCNAVLDKLEDNGLVDDRRYAENTARKLVVTKKYGLRRAQRELMQKGIDKFTAEDALAEYSGTFGENLYELLETKHSRLLADPSDRRSIEKAKSALVRYGYSYDEINRAVREYLENMEEEDQCL